MEFIKTSLSGAFLIKPKVLGDHRGYFYESFRLDRMREHGIEHQFVQDNQSLSAKGILRGLHFQAPPFEQGKLVRVIKGAIVDVIVDIRAHSPTYGKSELFELNEENKHLLWVPPGFAHGFVTLENENIVSYKCTNYYNRDSEGAILWNSPALAIEWPISDPILSEKDAGATDFSAFSSPF